MHEYYSKRGDLSYFHDNELRAWASNDYKELNKTLKNEGFAIQLEPFTHSEDFGVISILDVAVEWLNQGNRTIFHSEFNGTPKEFPAVLMKEDFEVYLTAVHNHPIAALKTKSGDRVYMTIANKKLEAFALQNYITHLHNNLHLQNGYATLEFPMVDLNKEENIKWLLEMQLPEGWKIAQAL